MILPLFVPSPLAGEGEDGGEALNPMMKAIGTIRARVLRSDPTDAERTLWRHLRYRGISGHKFRRQQLVGAYIVDFICYERRLIIELDGGQHNEQVAVAYDVERTVWLESQGFRVLRFWNHQVFNDIDAVKTAIWMELDGHPHPNLPPSRGKGLRREPTPVRRG